MISESKEKPIYNPNSAFYIYLHGQEVDYTGEGQLPVPMLNGVRNDDIMDLSDPAIKYKYRKVGDKNSHPYGYGSKEDYGRFFMSCFAQKTYRSLSVGKTEEK